MCFSYGTRKLLSSSGMTGTLSGALTGSLSFYPKFLADDPVDTGLIMLFVSIVTVGLSFSWAFSLPRLRAIGCGWGTLIFHSFKKLYIKIFICLPKNKHPPNYELSSIQKRKNNNNNLSLNSHKNPPRNHPLSLMILHIKKR